jgi:hypothetical protein
MKWDTFFSEDNEIALRWSTLVDTESLPRLELKPFLDLVEQQAPVAALPRVRAGSKVVHWYIGWRQDSDARFAHDLLRAFLGRTYAAMKEPIRPLDPVDAVEREFAEEFQGRAFRVEVDWELRKEARRQLRRLATRLLERPGRLARQVRPVGRILRDLEFALQNGDDTAAKAEIQILRTGGHLDEANLVFLELRRLGALGDWAQLLGHRSLSSVLGFRAVPWRVRQVLLQAVFHVRLADVVARGDVTAALTALRPLLNEFAVAFTSRRHLSGIEAEICFRLADASRGVVWDDGGAGPTDVRDVAPYAKFWEGLRAHQEARSVSNLPVRLPTLEEAQQALANFDLDKAFSVAAACPPTVQRARVLLHCARVLQSDESVALEAISACDLLSDSDRVELFSFSWAASAYDALTLELGRSAQQLTASSPAPTPTKSWRDWFARIRSGSTWPGAVARAVVGVSDWNIEEVAADADVVSEVVETIGANLQPWAADALRQSLPSLLDAFLGESPDVRLATIVVALFELLATDDALSAGSVAALIRLSQHRLATSTFGYADVLAALVTAVQEALSPGIVRQVSDALELLVTTPCASKPARDDAAFRLASCVSKLWSRLDVLDRALFRELCGELGVAETLPADTKINDSALADGTHWGASLEGRFVALYSLTRSALDRAVAVLQEVCPKVRVKAFAEHGGTTPMRDAARTADLFVIATKSATHSATDAITHNRKGPIEFAAGKGTATLVEAVRRWVEKGMPLGV